MRWPSIADIPKAGLSTKLKGVEAPAAAEGDLVGPEDAAANECAHRHHHHHHHSCNICDACNICGAYSACNAFEKATGQMTPRSPNVKRLI